MFVIRIHAFARPFATVVSFCTAIRYHWNGRAAIVKRVIVRHAEPHRYYALLGLIRICMYDVCDCAINKMMLSIFSHRVNIYTMEWSYVSVNF